MCNMYIMYKSIGGTCGMWYVLGKQRVAVNVCMQVTICNESNDGGHYLLLDFHQY